MKVLIGAPVRQDERVFVHYLNSLKKLNSKFDVFFYLHNSPHLAKYLEKSQYELIETPSKYEPLKHNWNQESLSDVSIMKNMLLEKTLKEGYDYFFLVDSDVILHPETLNHLLSLKKDIVAELTWGKIENKNYLCSNAWEFDFFDYKKRTKNIKSNLNNNKDNYAFDLIRELNRLKISLDLPDINLDTVKNKLNAFINHYYEEVNERFYNFNEKIYNKKGLFKVGGVCGCNLISKKVIEAGINYEPIYNVSWTNWEDRAFCVRAAVHNFNMYLDTHYPATHLYDEQNLINYEESLK